MKLLCAILGPAIVISGLSCERAPDLTLYEGRYAKGSLNLVIVSLDERGLTVRPLFWRSVQLLSRSGADSFGVVDRPDRSLLFIRKGDGTIRGAHVWGLGADGFYRRLADEAKPAIMDLFGDDAARAAQELIADSSVRSEDLLNVAKQFLATWPSKARNAEKFLGELNGAFPQNDHILCSWADAHVALGNRTEAARLYEQAVAINPSNPDAARALVRLGLRRPEVQKDALKISFSLEELFAPATELEISQVWDEWATRDLRPAEWKELERWEMPIAGLESTVRIMAHKVHGNLHYGAIVLPHGAESAPRPVMIEARGVSWDYKAFDLERNLRLPHILGDRSRDFVYVIPSFRGERIVVGGREYLSEGDRTNAWDGATDDVLALLELALRTTPEADSTRIGIFGQSRGGSVALLAAIRDARIRAVVSWCGPVDWFTHMGTGGWSLEEIVREGVQLNAVPAEPGGQFIERYLRRPFADERTLRFARHRMIASSPLYFVQHLPLVRCSYGREDSMVPVSNAESLIRAFLGSPDRQCSIVEGAGHDLEWTEEAEAREFLIQTFLRSGGR